MDFSQAKVSKRKKKGEAEGQLRIRYRCKEKQFSRDRGDWSVEIAAVNGGILETEDIYLNQAPEYGYKEAYRLSMQQDDPGYRNKVVKQFYFTANDGRFYGGFIAKFYPYSYDRPKISIGYKVNPTGSRALTSR